MEDEPGSLLLSSDIYRAKTKDDKKTIEGIIARILRVGTQMSSRIFNYAGTYTTSVYENAGLPHDIAPPLYLCFESFKSEKSFKTFRSFVHSPQPSNRDIFTPDWLSQFILIPLNKIENLFGKQIIEVNYGSKDVLPAKLKVIQRVAILTKLMNVLSDYGQDPTLTKKFEKNNPDVLRLIKDKKIPAQHQWKSCFFYSLRFFRKNWQKSLQVQSNSLCHGKERPVFPDCWSN